MLGRAFAAFTLTVGFYATCSHTLATAMIAGPIAGWVIEGQGNLWLTIVLVLTVHR